jgi:hypothetical protein
VSRLLHILGQTAALLLGIGVVERRHDCVPGTRNDVMGRKRTACDTAIDHAKAMAIQLAEIRALPEVTERP